MDKDQWTKIREIFTHLSEQSPSFRNQYLDMVCEDQPVIRSEVEKMLSANDQLSTLHTPGIELANHPPLQDFAGYKVTGELGRGGMSTVYSADHAVFGTVALKVLPGHLVSHPVAMERFKQEAALLQKIDHPALCRVFEIAMQDNVAVIAMERAAGSTLEALLRNDPPGLGLALHIGSTVADVLAEAHRHGVIHRDLKPSNIIIDDDNHLKLIDFGIAKIADANLTAPGEVMGSPAYMSPEQWRGKPIGPETDVWSLGVVLLEMLTGHNPFVGESIRDTARLVLDQASVPLPSLDVYPILQGQLQSLLLQMINKNRRARISSMDTVHSRLQALIDRRV